MKLIIFGATGSVGKPLVLQALGLHHHVTAFVRSDKALAEFEHPDLRIIEGDAFDLDAVRKAIAGHDAVFCVLGAGRKGGVRASATRNIIQAMKELKLNRFICQSTLGAGDSNANLNFFWKDIMFGWFLKPAFLHHEEQEDLVKRSDLDWTIVRPTAFTDGPVTGEFHHGFSPTDKAIKLKISRADVAMFLLMQLQTKEYLRKTPGQPLSRRYR